MKPECGNLYANVAARAPSEHVLELLSAQHVRIERIVSTGQATPDGEWLQQDRAEFVTLLTGSAGLRFEGDGVPRVLRPGDYLAIAPRRRHRVDWTAKDEPSVWLAIHYE
jgi:cupin 2 domain-containing protein